MSDVDESTALDDADRELLREWNFYPEDPRAREIVLIGRLQRLIGVVVVDGTLGPRTTRELRLWELDLGPELERILCFHGLAR